MKRTARLIALALAMVGAAAPLTARAALVHVSVNDFNFSPATITVEQGDQVEWDWTAGVHTTTSGTPCTADGLWNAQITSGNPTFTFTFNSTGTFPYFCTFHCAINMVGSVTVQSPSSVPSSPKAGQAALVLSATPNPFSPSTDVKFDLAQAGHVRVGVYDSAGREIALLQDGSLSAGAHTLQWNGHSDKGADVPSGVYYLRSWSPQGRAFATLIKLR